MIAGPRVPALRRIIAVVISLMVVAVAAHARPIVVDGSAADWTGHLPPVQDLGHIQRDAGRHGEFVWRDATGDARAVPGVSGLDLTEVRITGDQNHLYVLARLTGPVVTSGAGAPQLQVAIDTDHFAGLGQPAFAHGAATAVASGAEWERLVVTRFGSGQSPEVLDAGFAPRTALTQGALSADGVVEVAVPWTIFDSPDPPFGSLRFTVALFASAADDSDLLPTGAAASRAVDGMTDYGDPGSLHGTLDETADGVVDHYADVYFDAHAEPYAPVVVSETCTLNGINSEWVEVYNASSGTVQLGTWKIGDSDVPDNNEAMGYFPYGTRLYPGQAFVVAQNGTTFYAEHGFRAGAEFKPSDAATPDITLFAPWASTTIPNLPSGGDQVLLVDPCNTVMDVYTFKNAVWPGVTAYPGVKSGDSVERSDPGVDTDDCTLDFIDQVSPTPGNTPPSLAVGPGTGMTVPVPTLVPNPFRGRVALALPNGGVDGGTVQVFDTLGRRVRALAFSPGTRVTWDGLDDRGRPAPEGLYLFSVSTPAGISVVRGALLR
jgi:hypothetical protein